MSKISFTYLLSGPGGEIERCNDFNSAKNRIFEMLVDGAASVSISREARPMAIRVGAREDRKKPYARATKCTSKAKGNPAPGDAQ